MAILATDDLGKTVAHIEIVPLGKSTLEEQYSDESRPASYLLESSNYEYRVREKNLQIREFPRIVSRTQLGEENIDRGTIKTGLYVGILPLVIETRDGRKLGRATVEVRSRKLKYESEFRTMLEDIAGWSLDLLGDLRSGIAGYYVPDSSEDWSSLQQRFFLLSGIVGSSSFLDALRRILAYPDSAIKTTEELTDIRKAVRWNSAIARQFASSSKRQKLPHDHYLRMEHGLESAPTHISSNAKTESFDTPANRFVKFVLSRFEDFLSDLMTKLELIASKKHKEDPRDQLLLDEVKLLRDKISEFLSQSLFLETGNLSHIPAGNPVLQRKSGYREILLAWLKFQLGSHLTWEGSDDAYLAGQKNVAALYEYWCFFCILEVFKTVTTETNVHDSLFELTSDGFGLKLKAGKTLGPIVGKISQNGKDFHALLFYNKSFTHNTAWSEEGSWSRQLRPDYTIEIWPHSVDKSTAEINNLIVRLHFDAKYRIKFSEIFRDTDDNSEVEQVTRKDYSPESLLKMHAYKDAIRRSDGAYVLYPGEDIAHFKGYREILPGVGVFPLRPDSEGSDIETLNTFIFDIVSHLLDRLSARERLRHHEWMIATSKTESMVSTSFPELDKLSDGTSARMMPPNEYSLLGLKNHSPALHSWVEKTGKLPISTDEINSLSANLSQLVNTNRILILQDSSHLLEYNKVDVSIQRGESLLAEGYPLAIEEDSVYTVFELALCNEESAYFQDTIDTFLSQSENLFWMPASKFIGS